MITATIPLRGVRGRVHLGHRMEGRRTPLLQTVPALELRQPPRSIELVEHVREEAHQVSFFTHSCTQGGIRNSWSRAYGRKL